MYYKPQQWMEVSGQLHTKQLQSWGKNLQHSLVGESQSHSEHCDEGANPTSELGFEHGQSSP